MKRALKSETARAKEKTQLSHDGSSLRQPSGTDQHVSVIIESVTHRPAIEEETITINRDWVYNQACWLPYKINTISHSFTGSERPSCRMVSSQRDKLTKHDKF